ncbi:MAG: hypothetical protein ACKVIK_06790 [Rhodospirillales bacterium]
MFTYTIISPNFIELTQLKSAQRFGKGNIQALFDSIEPDQLARGIL